MLKVQGNWLVRFFGKPLQLGWKKKFQNRDGRVQNGEWSLRWDLEKFLR